VTIARSTVIPVLIATALAGSLAACGKKGPPLAPLRLVPAAATQVTARRTGPNVTIRFVLPDKNQNGPGTIDLDRVEIYAVTIGAGSPVPPNRDLMTKERVVGTIAVKPPPVEDAPPPPNDADKRPSPGERAVFVDELTPEKLIPVKAPPPAAKAAPGDAAAKPGDATTKPEDVPAKPEEIRLKPDATQPGAPQGGALPAVAQVPAPPPDYPVRVYVIRGISKANRPGPPAERVTIPLVAVPSPPAALAVKPTERHYALDWGAPVAEAGQPAIAFNVYLRGQEDAPLNGAPVTDAKFQHEPIKPGEEVCFVVSSVQVVRNIPLESEASPPACSTWTDVYAPAAPKGLQAVAGDDGISLSWDANAEPDVSGYLVLRAEAPGDTLQPLVREPIRQTNYRDTAVQSGVRYVYAIVALDKASPPNTSQPSERQEVTAR
jgi:predicted small lipoprotein YifL